METQTTISGITISRSVNPAMVKLSFPLPPSTRAIEWYASRPGDFFLSKLFDFATADCAAKNMKSDDYKETEEFKAGMTLMTTGLGMQVTERAILYRQIGEPVAVTTGYIVGGSILCGLTRLVPQPYGAIARKYVCGGLMSLVAFGLGLWQYNRNHHFSVKRSFIRRRLEGYDADLTQKEAWYGQGIFGPLCQPSMKALAENHGARMNSDAIAVVGEFESIGIAATIAACFDCLLHWVPHKGFGFLVNVKEINDDE